MRAHFTSAGGLKKSLMDLVPLKSLFKGSDEEKTGEEAGLNPALVPQKFLDRLDTLGIRLRCFFNAAKHNEEKEKSPGAVALYFCSHLTSRPSHDYH